MVRCFFAFPWTLDAECWVFSFSSLRHFVTQSLRHRPYFFGTKITLPVFFVAKVA